MSKGLLLTKGGWEPADMCPSLRPLTDNSRRYSLYFPEVPAKWTPLSPIMATLLMH